MKITAFIGFLDPKNPRIAARITSIPQILWEIGYLIDLAAILDAILNISISPRVPGWHPVDSQSGPPRESKSTENNYAPNFALLYGTSTRLLVLKGPGQE